jgi:hypothetical protein
VLRLCKDSPRGVGRQATLVPLVQTAQALIQQLGNLLNSGGNPAQVGAVVIQIHALQQQMAQAQQAFLTQFIAILDAQQLQKLRPRSCSRYFRSFSRSFSSDSNGLTDWVRAARLPSPFLRILQLF